MRSKFERRIAKEIKDAGVTFTYESYSYQYFDRAVGTSTFCLNCGHTDVATARWYTPDFFLSNGIIVETKGKWTAPDRRKMLAVIEEYPDEDFRMLFMRDNKLHPKSPTRYSDWCIKNNIRYAVGYFPAEWAHENTST